MRNALKLLLITAMMLLILSGCVVQRTLQAPDQIDPYSFDPAKDTGVNNYSALAYKEYSDGKYEKAAQYYLAYLQSKPDDNLALYNLSCCYGLLGKSDLAAKYLMRSYKAGFTNLEHIGADTDFEKVREQDSFVAAMDSLQVWSDRKAYYAGEVKYLETSQLTPYRIHLPKDFDPLLSYPLLIGLHGYGDQAAAFSRLWKYLENEEVIFVVPEAPYPFTEGNIGFSWQPPLAYDSYETGQAFDLLTQYVFDLQDELAAEYYIDQTWLLGFSQGAYMSYLIGIKNPTLIDGLVVCGGGLVTDYISDDEYKAATELKIIISHGKQDKVVAYDEALNAQKILEDKGFSNVRFEDFEGGHSVNPAVFKSWLEWIEE